MGSKCTCNDSCSTECLIVVYCGFVKCARSHNAAVFAQDLGYTNVKRYAGGIYAWRGAKPENLVQLSQDFKNLKVIKLEQNYRSTRRILKLANELIKNNPHVYEKRLWSDLGMGEGVRLIQCHSEEDEGERVAREAQPAGQEGELEGRLVEDLHG